MTQKGNAEKKTQFYKKKYKYVFKCKKVEEIETQKSDVSDEDLQEETLMLPKHEIQRGNCENINSASSRKTQSLNTMV